MFFNELVPGRLISMHYEDDREIWHERILVWRADAQRPPTRWTILTPDGDIYDEELASGEDGDGPNMVSLTFGATPARQRPPGRVYRFRTYPTEVELMQMVRASACALFAVNCDATKAMLMSEHSLVQPDVTWCSEVQSGDGLVGLTARSGLAQRVVLAKGIVLEARSARTSLDSPLTQFLCARPALLKPVIISQRVWTCLSR